MSRAHSSRQPQTITSVASSASDDRRSRTTQYLIAQGLRVVLMFTAIFVPGWWALICIAGAIVLPYFAVVLGNVSVRPSGPSSRAVGDRELEAPAPADDPRDGPTP